MYKMYMCLKWNDYQENAISTSKTLREDREFSDVTLVCEDGQQVEAHKVILASSSPFFLNILKKHKHPHPLIFMRKLSFEDLVAMLDFIYIGEANVHQDNLDSFLAVAEELQLKGLVGSGTKEEVEGEQTKGEISQQQEESYSQVEAKKTHISETNFETKEDYAKQNTGENYVGNADSLDPLDEYEPVLNDSVDVDFQDLNDKIDSMIERVENSTRLVKCQVCGNEGPLNHIRAHIEAKHITGVSFTCDICGKASKTRDYLRRHKRRHIKTVHPRNSPKQKEISHSQDEEAKTDVLSSAVEVETEAPIKEAEVTVSINDFSETFTIHNKPEATENYLKQKNEAINISSSVDKAETVDPLDESENLFDQNMAADLLDQSDKIKSMMEPTGKIWKDYGKNKQYIWQCKVCGKESGNTQIRSHIEVCHIGRSPHTCNFCGKVSYNRFSLKSHIKRLHSITN